MLDFIQLCENHKSFIGHEPEAEAQGLFRGYVDGLRGFANRRDQRPKQASEIRLDATLTLALGQILPQGEESGTHIVYLYVNPLIEAWALQQIDKHVKGIFERSTGKPTQVYAMQAIMGKLMFSKTPPMTAPERWAAFGFDGMSAIPEWAKKALLKSEVSHG